jgi:pimeloyl-ACP methyl ester carboxylesterase
MKSTESTVRGLRYAFNEWGDSQGPLVMLLHGWMDTGRSYRYLVEHLQAGGAPWRFIAPDWRGHGRSQWAPEAVYRYPDYLADLDLIVDALSPKAPIVLIGHSMGGNIATLYASTRQSRVRALVNVEGFGLRDQQAEHLPAQLRNWLNDLKRARTRRPYSDLEAVVVRVRELRAKTVNGNCALTRHYVGRCRIFIALKKPVRCGVKSRPRFFGSRPSSQRTLFGMV